MNKLNLKSTALSMAGVLYLAAPAAAACSTGLFDDLFVAGAAAPQPCAKQLGPSVQRPEPGAQPWQQATLTMAERVRPLLDKQRADWIAKFGTLNLDLKEVYWSRIVEAADRFDRRRLTYAQLELEQSRAYSELVSATDARAAERERAYEARTRALSTPSASDYWLWSDPAPRRAEPTPPPAALTRSVPSLPIDCSVTPGSLGRSVSCW